MTISSEAPADLDVLARGIDLGNGVAFYFLVVDDLHLRAQAIADLRVHLRRRHIRRVRIRERDHNLLDLLRKLPEIRADEVLVVTGIENVLQDADNAPFIRSLNAARDAFARVVRGPVLFVLSSFALKLIIAGAPDFFSARSGTDFYRGQLKRSRREPLHQGAGVDLSAIESREIIDEAEQLLNRLDSGVPSDLFLRRAQRMVVLLLNRHELDRAADIAARAFTLARNSPRQAVDFAFYLSQIARLRGDRSEAQRFAHEAKKLAEILGDHTSRLRALWLKADASEPNDPGATPLYLEALALAKEVGDSHAAAQLEMSLAIRCLRDGAAELSLRWLADAELDANRSGDRPLIAEILSTKAAALVGVGWLSEAEHAVRQSLSEFERLGDTVQMSMANIDLGDVLLAQERFDEAEDAFRRSLDLIPRSPVLPTRAIVPLLRLVAIKLQTNDVAAAEALGREALSLIERFRDELPDSKSVEQSLHELMDEASSRGATAR